MSFCIWSHIESKDACWSDVYPDAPFCPKHLLILLQETIVACKDSIELYEYEQQFDHIKQYISKHPELVADFLES